MTGALSLYWLIQQTINWSCVSYFFPRKQGLILHANCLHWNVKFCFLGIKKENHFKMPAEISTQSSKRLRNRIRPTAYTCIHLGCFQKCQTLANALPWFPAPDGSRTRHQVEGSKAKRLRTIWISERSSDRFSAIYKGDNFHDFLFSLQHIRHLLKNGSIFGFLYMELLLKGGPLWKERIISQWNCF